MTLTSAPRYHKGGPLEGKVNPRLAKAGAATSGSRAAFGAQLCDKLAFGERGDASEVRPLLGDGGAGRHAASVVGSGLAPAEGVFEGQAELAEGGTVILHCHLLSLITIP
jgi:hypothetical protein